MPSEAAIEALRRHRAQESDDKKSDVLSALDEMNRNGTRVTIAGVARAASVSREFIHSHPALHGAVTAVAAADRIPRSTPESIRWRDGAGLRADRATLLSRVERDKRLIVDLKASLADFQAQRKRWLGSQLDEPAAVDPEVYAELRIAHERLVADARGTDRQLVESRRLVQVLESDLAASRQAHAEDVQRLSNDGGNVIAFGRLPRHEVD